MQGTYLKWAESYFLPKRYPHIHAYGCTIHNRRDGTSCLSIHRGIEPAVCPPTEVMETTVCPSTEGWNYLYAHPQKLWNQSDVHHRIKMWYRHTMEFYAVAKRNEIYRKWMDLEYYYINWDNPDSEGQTSHIVLVRATIAVMKHHDESNLGRKGLISAHTSR